MLTPIKRHIIRCTPKKEKPRYRNSEALQLKPIGI